MRFDTQQHRFYAGVDLHASGEPRDHYSPSPHVGEGPGVRAALRASAAKRTAPLPKSFDVLSIAATRRRRISRICPRPRCGN
jgi:hypothetical protein